MSENQPRDPSRRKALALGVGVGAAGLAGAVGLAGSGATPEVAPVAEDDAMTDNRLPVVYLPHGGGPWPFVEIGMGDRAEWAALAQYLTDLRVLPRGDVKAVLAVSAHWEEDVPTVMTAARPPMLYDYYGFPKASYEITWPAPGAPEVAERIRHLLRGAGFASASDERRGFDHGTFVPLKLTYPNADVPTLQLSLKRGLDPTEHVAIGRALQPLRDEGVFIVGSGMSYHNMRGFGPQGAPASEAFDAWLGETIRANPDERERRLSHWATAPSARAAHPREEHLLPLMVVAGAAGADSGTVGFNGTVMGVRVSAYHFG